MDVCMIIDFLAVDSRYGLLKSMHWFITFTISVSRNSIDIRF